MYNYQQYVKGNKEATALKRLQRLQREEELRREELAKTLIANHDKRIEHSILTLIEHPQKINPYHDPTYHPREEDKAKRVVHRQMTYNYQRESQRINNALQRNSSLDLVPFRNPSLYHFRDSRLEDSKLVPSRWKTKESRASMDGKESVCSQLMQGEQRGWRKGGVQRLPNLERLPKTYFHSLQTIINKPDTLRVTIDEKGIEKVSLSHMNGHEMQSKESENRDQRCRIKQDKLQKCKLALQKCGVIPEEESRASRHISIR